jgi:hypothetical protein
MLVVVTYLSDRDMSDDARSLVIQDIRTRLDIKDANVKLKHINTAAGEILFEEDKSILPLSANTTLDKIGTLLKNYPALNLNISISRRSSEQLSFEKSRYNAIELYLFTKWQIGQERLGISTLSRLSSKLTPNKLRQDGRTLLRLNANN